MTAQTPCVLHCIDRRMSTGPRTVTRPETLITSEILTQPDQFMMTPKVGFSKYGINILYVIKFIFFKCKVQQT